MAMAIYPVQLLTSISHQLTRCWTWINPHSKTTPTWLCNSFIEHKQLRENPTCEGLLMCLEGNVFYVKQMQFNPILYIYIYNPILLLSIMGRFGTRASTPGQTLWSLPSLQHYHTSPLTGPTTTSTTDQPAYTWIHRSPSRSLTGTQT